MKHYLVVIPAYDEAEYIGSVVDDVRKYNPYADILVVNDGSADATSDIAKQRGVMVLNLPFNIGYGGAVQTGFRFAVDYGYDMVVTLDGDAQHDPASVKNLFDAMDDTAADFVVGSRFLEGAYKMGFARKLGVWLFSRIARLHTGTGFTDPTSGFQLLDRKVFSYLAEGNNYPLDYPDVNIIMALHKMEFRIVETKVRMKEKPKGKSMHSGWRPILYVIRMFLAIIMVLIRKEERQS